MMSSPVDDPDSETPLAKPFKAVTVMVEVAVVPRLTGGTMMGLAVMPKSTTWNRILTVECVSEVLFPKTVTL